MRRLPLPGNAAVSYDLRAIAPGSCPPVLEAGSRLSPWVGKAVGALAAQGPGGGPHWPLTPRGLRCFSAEQLDGRQGAARPQLGTEVGRAYGQRPLARRPRQALAPVPA